MNGSALVSGRAPGIGAVDTTLTGGSTAGVSYQWVFADTTAGAVVGTSDTASGSFDTGPLPTGGHDYVDRRRRGRAPQEQIPLARMNTDAGSGTLELT